MTKQNTKQRKIKLKYVFYAEGALNFIIFFICIIAPDFFIKQMTTETYTTVAIEFIYWYGALLLILTSMMIAILIIENKQSFLAILICYFVGDLLQIILAIHFAITLNSWTLGIIITIILSTILAIIRIVIFIRPNWLGFKESKRENIAKEKEEEII
ncbi:MAG: hypothetical protein JXA54_02000 [Candidatus Heimdallarchaeota archaeon]|nr:hypothetical protein [Candidatus Heimdallarchaeota archaeon]